MAEDEHNFSEIKVLDHGYVRLIDHMPRENLDDAIVEGARVSYGQGTKQSRGSRGLLRYLLRHWHTSPFELVSFKFQIKLPIYIARQLMRHRTCSVNELSARYSVVEEEAYEPDILRGQSEINKQCSDGVLEDLSSSVNEEMHTHIQKSFELYNSLLSQGVCREQARGLLPQSTYTSIVWKMDLHNLMHFLQLRMHETAQWEIREYANAIFKLIEPLVPLTMEAFKDFRLDAITLTGPEIEALNTGKPIEAPGEKREFEEKLKHLRIKIS
jgi:thymidylate synthase (FAD)